MYAVRYSISALFDDLLWLTSYFIKKKILFHLGLVIHRNERFSIFKYVVLWLFQNNNVYEILVCPNPKCGAPNHLNEVDSKKN